MSEISIAFGLIVKQQKSMNHPVVSFQFISLREYQYCPNDLLKNSPLSHGPLPPESGVGVKPLAWPTWCCLRAIFRNPESSTSDSQAQQK